MRAQTAGGAAKQSLSIAQQQQTMVQVTVPPGVVPGQTIAVQSSAGLVQATVPPSCGPGSTFVVSVAAGQAPISASEVELAVGGEARAPSRSSSF